MSANSKIALRISKHSYLNHIKKVFTHIWFYKTVCTHIKTLLWPCLYSNLDLTVMKFALIYGPYCDQVCTHIWTLLLWSLHSYLVPIITKFAVIVGPLRYWPWNIIVRLQDSTVEMDIIRNFLSKNGDKLK